jgi:hypothetical protein
VMKFAGKPSITLGTETYDGRGSEDVAWDAVAIEPLAAKPRHFVVALGDSYASGEGASDPTGDDYYKETDNNGALDDDKGRNACHRSPFAWTRLGWLADNASASIGARGDSWDSSIDFQMHSCSGARTHNMLPFHTATPTQEPRNAFGIQGKGQYGEMTQIDKGYLDENTTLVTLAIGGNDARFTDVIKECIYGGGFLPCPDTKLSGESEPLKVTVPRAIDGPVRDSVLLTLREIHARAPNAHIVLMGYPRLLENSGGCIAGIGTEEAPWLNLMVDRMAATLDGVAVQATIEGATTWFSNPIEEFSGKAICGDPESIHGIVSNTTAGDKPQFLGTLPPSIQSFHPKAIGTPLYADSFNETLRRMGR